MNLTIREERLKVPTVKGGQLFLRHMERQDSTAVVLLLHDLGCDGGVFVKEGAGLANYLCEMGYACFIPDLVGHGQSWPHISRHLEHNVHDIILEDILRLVEEVERHLKGRPLFLVGHGFGSVLLLSSFSRHEKIRQLTSGFIHFNARRSTVISGVAHSYFGRLFWRKLLPLIARFRGDVPLQWFADKSQPEMISWYKTYIEWAESDWVDDVDQFNYGSQLREENIPPSLYFSAKNKGYLSSTSDVREFMRELGTHNGRLLVLAKHVGNLRNYNALTMIQHDDAWVDHFPLLLDWLNERCKGQAID